MTEIDCTTERSEGIDMIVVESERSPKPFEELGVRLHVAEFSLSDTIFEFDNYGAVQSWKPTRDEMPKAVHSPDSDGSPVHVAIDEIVVHGNDLLFVLRVFAVLAMNIIHLSG